MSAIVDRIARRQINKSGFAHARGKELVYTDPKATITVSDAAPYAKFLICTDDVDGSGDRMQCKGCLPHLDRFRRNPVIFYDHYDPVKQNRVKYPIGKADGPAGTTGKLDLEVTDHAITMGCWFSTDTEEARDVFRLVKNKFLRSTSISFLPRRAEKLRDSDGYHYLEFELTEVSIVGVPDNPFTGTLEVKSLQLESPALRSSWSNGITLEQPPMPADKFVALQFSKKLWTKEKALDWLKKQNHDASLSEEIDGKLVFHQGASDQTKWGEHKQLGKGLVGILGKQQHEQQDDPETGEEAAEDEKPLPPGAGVLKDNYGHHKGVHAYNEAMLDHIENPHVLKHMADEMDNAQKCMQKCMGTHSKAYPDIDFNEMVGEEPDTTEPEKKSKKNLTPPPAEPAPDETIAKALKAMQARLAPA